MSSLKSKCRIPSRLMLIAGLSGFAASAAMAQDQAGNRPAQVQWASKVLDKSSEETDRLHSARWTLGWPNSGAQGGFSGAAWQPKKDGGAEHIKVGFDRPMRISRVLVIENANPGSVTRVAAYDAAGKEYVLKSFKAGGLKEKSRTLAVDVPKTEYEVAAIRVDMNTGAVPGIQQIDAIGIVDGQAQFQPVRTAFDLDVNSQPEKLGNGINTQFADFGPVISPDGGTLYFSRRKHPQNVGGKEDMEDIWVSRFNPQTKTWQPAENIGKPLNNESHNFVSSVSPDGNTLLLGNMYLEDGSMDAGASISTRTPQGWGFPKPIGIIKEKNKNKKVDYFLSSSGRILLISAEQKDTWGSRDLYVSFRQTDELWSEPVNLGETVNTPNEEYAPFLAADERTLYFSTSGHAGYGGDDIFITRRIGNGWDKWTEPENLGKPINTPANDAFFTLPASGEHAYYASAGSTPENLDIYRVSLPRSQRPRPVVLITGRTLDSKTNKPVATRVVYEDLKTGKQVGEANSDPQTGQYRIALPSGDNYGYLAVADKYFSVSSNLDLTGLNDYKEVVNDLMLTPGEVGATVRLNNLFFDQNKAELRQESYPELNRLASFLKANPTTEIEIAGHTDSIGNLEYNQKLSQDRVQAVVNYLSQNGVGEARLAKKAYGETRPLADNGNEQGRQQNRRVEFVLRKM